MDETLAMTGIKCCYCIVYDATRVVEDHDGDELAFCDTCWGVLEGTSDLVARSIAK